MDSLSEGGSLDSPSSIEEEDDDGGSLASDEEIPRSTSSATHEQLPVDDTDAAEFSAISERSLKEDVEKGHAVKHQLGQ